MASNGRGKTSLEQIEANRRNAQLSTGPKSKDGKEAVRRNALKHGLLAKESLLPGDDADAFRELSERIYADQEPEGAIETALVEQIIGALWRLRRARRVEAGILENEICGAARDREDEGMPQNDRMMRDMMNPRSAPSAEERRKAVENASAADWGAAFMRDANRGNAFSKLSRYETAIERSFMKSLHELQRLQAARLGGSAPLPVAADVDVSVSTD